MKEKVVKGEYMTYKSIKWFSAEMRKKMAKNEHKEGWDKCSHNYLFKRLCDEVLELNNALFTPKQGAVRSLNAKAIIKECADIANFVMMIADKMRKK